MKANVWMHLIGLALICSLGDALFKRSSLLPSPYTSGNFIIGSAIYAMCGFSWVVILRSCKLSTSGILFSVVWSILLTALGFFVFKEQITTRESAGIFLGIAAIYLLGK
jgi:drug/metabolite transporter (DMT)-like permease